MIFDPDRAPVLEQDAGGVCVGRDRQVVATARRAQIGSRRAPTPAMGGGCLVIADTLLPGAVEIGVVRDAGLDGGGDHGVAERRAHRVRYVQRPARAVELIAAALLVLRLLEERQHRIPIPPFTAALAPTVVIGRRAAHIDHAVDRAGAAQDLAARLVEGAVVELLLGLGLEHPVITRVGEGLGVAERYVDPRVGVAPAGFEQQHAIATGFAEPSGDRAARRSGTGNDEVVSVVCCRHSFVPRGRLWGTIAKPARIVKRRLTYIGALPPSVGRATYRLMCGRARLSSDVSEIKLVFSIPPERPTPNIPANWNAAPTEDLPVVRYDAKAGQRSLDVMRWGLVPFWAKDIKVGFANINAKAEGIETRPAFREAFARRRCLVPFDCFYDWQKLGKDRQPYGVGFADRRLMALAGVWETWRSPAGERVRSFAIITTAANALLAPVHDRMPVILAPETWRAWLGESTTDPDELKSLLVPYPAEDMVIWPVDKRVGKVANKDPSLIEPTAVA